MAPSQIGWDLACGLVCWCPGGIRFPLWGLERLAGNSLGYLDPGLCTGDQVMPALAMELVPGGVAFNGVHLIWTGFGLAARLRGPAHAAPLATADLAGDRWALLASDASRSRSSSAGITGRRWRWHEGRRRRSQWVRCAAAVSARPPIFVQVNAEERLMADGVAGGDLLAFSAREEKQREALSR
ncbi:hypothetical protein PVAP13_7NG135085 [Panicum virgatum]|uniref:Uncharacterized protein n=1 Tax=Panicum virgatum TaxID=38727 RepID=A0A8T0PVK3_PANVG|nr:hypothetical protein PVAP13_7NG135085 [Panicum virgatum]